MKAGDLVKRSHWKVEGTQEMVGVVCEVQLDEVVVLWSYGRTETEAIVDLVKVDISENT